jgi:hypothetical protein
MNQSLIHILDRQEGKHLTKLMIMEQYIVWPLRKRPRVEMQNNHCKNLQLSGLSIIHPDKIIGQILAPLLLRDRTIKGKIM